MADHGRLYLQTGAAALDPERIRADFPILSRTVNGKPLIYLDSAATSQKPQVMIDRIAQLYGHEYARPEEGHSLSNEATKAFEGTRTKVARLINAYEPSEVIFTRGATEGLNLVALMITRSGLGPGDEVVITAQEHHSNLAPWVIACKDAGATLRVAPVTTTSDLDLEALEAMLSDRVRLLSVTHVSNVTGGINPVERICAMAKARGILVLVDGAQAVAHMPVDVRTIGCDFYTGSGHKMGGPSSVGFLWGRQEVLERMPIADSGSNMANTVAPEEVEPKELPNKYEAGEPAFGEVEAWSPAIDYWTGLGLANIAAYERDLTEYARRRLAEIAGVTLLGDPTDRISIVTFTVEGVDAMDVEKALDAEGIAVRAGSLEAQPFLKALGVEQAVRSSFVLYNTRREADALAAVVRTIAGAQPGG